MYGVLKSWLLVLSFSCLVLCNMVFSWHSQKWALTLMMPIFFFNASYNSLKELPQSPSYSALPSIPCFFFLWLLLSFLAYPMAVDPYTNVSIVCTLHLTLDHIVSSFAHKRYEIKETYNMFNGHYSLPPIIVTLLQFCSIWLPITSYITTNFWHHLSDNIVFTKWSSSSSDSISFPTALQ